MMIVSIIRYVRQIPVAAPFLLLLLAVHSVMAQEPENISFPEDANLLATPSDIFSYENVPATPRSFFPHHSWNNNIVTIHSGNVPGHLFGGIAGQRNFNSNGNTVNILGGSIGGATGTTGNITGGWTWEGNANNNTINISGNTTIYGIIFGGWLEGGSNNEALYNEVIINGSADTLRLRGNIYGAYTQGSSNVSNNSIAINGGEVWKLGAIVAGAYSAIGTSTVANNTITIGPGTEIRRADIYGGRGQGASSITGNRVTITGGNIHTYNSGETTIYGGNNFNGSGPVTGNFVDLFGGNINATIYGGRSTRGLATENTVTIGNTATTSLNLNGSNIWGGFANSGYDAFTGNMLNINFAAANIGTVQNFQYINFGTSGDAGITQIVTTPTGSSLSGVTLNSNQYEIAFNGLITGTGSLTKVGAGLLRLYNSVDIGGELRISEGTLALETSDITTEGGIIIQDQATLQLADGINLAEKITIDAENWGTIEVQDGHIATISGNIDRQNGAVAKTGDGTLILTSDNTIAGGWDPFGNIRVSQGTLQLGDGGDTGNISFIVLGGRYQVDGTLAFNHSDDITVDAIIGGIGKVVQRGTGTLTLANPGNSYQGGTEIERGSLNIVAPHVLSGYVTFTGADREDEVKKIALDLDDLMTDWPPELGGFALMSSFRTAERAGMNNIVNLRNDYNLPVWLSNNHTNDNGGAFYVAKNTEMAVFADNLMLAYNRANYGEDRNDLYVEETGTFKLDIADGGIVEFLSGIDGGGTLHITSEGHAEVILSSRLLSPISDNPFLANTYRMGDTHIENILFNLSQEGEFQTTFHNERTFTIDGNNEWGAMLFGGANVTAGESIRIERGVSISPDNWDMTTGERTPSTLTLNAPEVTLSDFILLYTAVAPTTDGGVNSLLEIDSSNPVSLTNGIIALTTSRNPEIVGDTFIAGDYLIMQTTNGFAGDAVNELMLVIDSFAVPSDVGSPRGTYNFELRDEDKNIWLTHALNSLTMQWTGEDSNNSSIWGGNNFVSQQVSDEGKRENSFLSGDKVHISGTHGILLPGEITVSGLIIGQNTALENVGGNVTISGPGGIRADASSAFGEYVGNSLTPTGKLEVYDTKITFTNTGSNYFHEGIDMNNAAIEFSRTNQLQVGEDRQITLMSDVAGVSVLQFTGSDGYPIADLRANIYVADGSQAKIDAFDGILLLNGLLSGGVDSKLTLSSNSIIQIGQDADANNPISITEIESGEFRVASASRPLATDSYTYTTGQFTLNSGATLAGRAMIIADSILIEGNISPDKNILTVDEPIFFEDEHLGTLTLFASAISLNNFTMNFDIGDGSNGTDSNKDLLVLGGDGSTVVNLGTNNVINFLGTLQTDTPYLIIRGHGNGIAGYSYDGDLNTIFTATLNGAEMNNTPRGTTEFHFGNENNGITDNHTDGSIWLMSSLNSLTMNWTGNDTVWNHTEGNFESLQTRGLVHDHAFQHGDEVAFYTNTEMTIAVPDTVNASQMSVGRERTATGTTYNGNVTFTGDGSINVDSTLAFGEYIGSTLENDGKLSKYGNGILSLENSGENYFADGIDLHGGTLQFQRANQINMGDGESIVFVDNATLKPMETVELTNTIQLGDAGKTATLEVEEQVALLLSGELYGEGNVEKTGAGTVQFSGDNIGTTGNTNVIAGVLRVAEDTNFGTDNLDVSSSAILAGSGTISVNGTVNGSADWIINPDSAIFTETKTDVIGDERFGTLTLNAAHSDASANLTHVRFDYDVSQDNHDLLMLANFADNNITLGNAVINFRAEESFAFTGKYLIIDAAGSEIAWDETGLTAWYNGNENYFNQTPRATAEFRFNHAEESESRNSQIWFEGENNSLTMVWQDGTVWNNTASNFESSQHVNSHGENVFQDGDYVVFNTDSSIELEEGIRRVSGLEVSENITFTGSGGIAADRTSAFGKYLHDGSLNPSGKLEVFDGRLTFANTGDNYFTDGIELHGGAIAFDRESQLQTDGRIAFVNDAELNLYGNSAVLDSEIHIANGATAGFNVNENIALVLTGNVDGNGNVLKTGAGILQFSPTAYNPVQVDATTVQDGEFRVVRGVTDEAYQSGNLAVASGATLAGGGIIAADSITISGIISPDSAVFASDHTTVDAENRFAALTLESNSITLDGFTFLYDVDGENQDLLVLRGESDVLLSGGTIEFRGAMTKASYLIIDSLQTIGIGNAVLDGINHTEGILKAAGVQAGSVRGNFEFVFEDGAATNSQIWLETAINSLTMHWTGNVDHVWDDVVGNFVSRQGADHEKENVFQAGDYMIVETDSNIEIAMGTRLVSGIEVHADVTFTGRGGITAADNDPSIQGRYYEAGTLSPSGRLGQLQVAGGTLTFANEGDNDFQEGIYLSGDSTLAFNNVNQLGNGNNDIHFTENASLRFESDSIILENSIVITDGNTATFEVVDDFNATLTKDIANTTGGIAKTGTGTLILSGTNTYTGGTTVNAGSLIGNTNSLQGDIRNDATVVFNQNMAGTYSGMMTGDGSLIKDGTGDLTLSGANTYTGGTTVNAGSLIGNTNSLQGDIRNDATVVFDQNMVGTYSGMMTGNGSLIKDGEETLRLAGNSPDYRGQVNVNAGALDVVGNYGNTAGVAVNSNALLTGTGTVGGTVVVNSGGTLRPGSQEEPIGTSMTVRGDLTFAEGSNFDVRITQDRNNYEPASDHLIVEGGTVNIESGAILNVVADYWDTDNPRHFTIIDAVAGTVGNQDAQFADVRNFGTLPLGVSLGQGWLNGLFQLWFEVGSNGSSFADIGDTPNQKEIGETVDDFIKRVDPSLNDVITDLSDPLLTDDQIRRRLDQISGDLTANALMLALNEPWRHPFNRLKLGCLVHDQTRRQLWGEFTARYENAGYDNNAHAFTINRYGVAVGVDERISHRSIVGATFQYSDPRLRQATGKVVMDDHIFGLYSLTRLTSHLEAKAYVGYSHQNYRFERSVAFMNQQLRGKTSGDALAASLELIRPIYWQRGVVIKPLMAFDFEQTWMRGYTETGGSTAQIYDRSTLERLMFRVGISSELAAREGFTLSSRVQYGTQLNGLEYPVVGVRFADGGANQRTANIWGSRIGRDYLNLGLGGNWKLDRLGHRSVYVNYDTQMYNRATMHVGEAGFITRW
ncbi:MAG: autotransporter domain-containing protein [Planctomycetaceae bacterium]|nr:autotransporter domain-containing protein [Planctomycetaceae bacterium]